MKKKSILTILIFLAGLGFGYGQSANKIGIPKQPEITKEGSTQITKDVLKERLGKKSIEFFPMVDPKTVKPNPLTLRLSFVSGGLSPIFKLNSETYKFDYLVKKLNSIYKDRETYGAFKEGTNEIEKDITLSAADSDIAFYNKHQIFVEDFERLIDNLRKAGIDYIKLDFNEGLRDASLKDIVAIPNSPAKRKPKKHK